MSNSTDVKRIAVMTSGGDSPGMNAAIRAVVRTGLHEGLEVYGIRQAYAGLIDGAIEPLNSRSVSGILKQGGTMLQTARLPQFKEPNYQRKAVRRLNEHEIDGLIVIGGNGSLTGALALHKLGVRTVGIPASIDNDVDGTATSIGVDTALNTIVDSIDRLRDTASSHERVFLVEVMGRDCGYLAIVAGLITGAEIVMIPEQPMTLDEMSVIIENAYKQGKTHALIISAEGSNLHVGDIKKYLDEHDIGFEARITILGHVQRGGSPSAFDRTLATRMGVAAVEAMIQGESGVMTSLVGTDIALKSLEDVLSQQRPLNPQYLDMAEILIR